MFNGEFPPHDIEPLARVVRVGNRAWPLSRFSGGVKEIKEEGVILTWEGEQASALDQTNIATSRKIAAIRTRDDAGNDIAHNVMFAFAFRAFWPDGVWMLENQPRHQEIDLFRYIHVLFQLQIGDSAKKDYVLISD